MPNSSRASSSRRPSSGKPPSQWIASGLKRKDVPETMAKVRVIGIDGLPGFLKGLR